MNAVHLLINALIVWLGSQESLIASSQSEGQCVDHIVLSLAPLRSV